MLVPFEGNISTGYSQSLKFYFQATNEIDKEAAIWIFQFQIPKTLYIIFSVQLKNMGGDALQYF